MRRLMIVLGFVVSSGFATAQTTPPPLPDCTSNAAPYRDLDFWVGVWDTTDEAGNPVGVNTITKEEGGCLLVETWTGRDGVTGRSLNFVDPDTGMWRQVWMNRDVLIDYTGGVSKSGAVGLKGEIIYTHSGENYPFIGTMQLNGDGTLTRTFKQFDPFKDDWQPWFTAIDTPRDAAAETPVVTETAASTPPACATDAAPYRDFDFWVGTWVVVTPDGAPAGTNTITRESGGCLLVETWAGASGSTGRSLNFVDPQTGLWRQVWMSQGALIDYAGGLTEDGTMQLEGMITYTGNGQSFPFRGRWTLNANATVTQEFNQYDPESETWAPWFTGIYAPRMSAPAE